MPSSPHKANFSNNDLHSLPEDLEAAWGKADPMTGKLDPGLVGSPRTTEVVVRGTPLQKANAASKETHMEVTT